MHLKLILVLFYVLVVLSAANGILGYGEDQQLFSFRKHSLFPYNNGSSSCSFQRSRKQNGATILEMKHKDQCSGQVKDWNKRHKEQLIADEVRIRSIQARIKNMISGQSEIISQARIPIVSGVRMQTLNYIVTVTLGGKNMTVIVDTGSDLTWVQCQPCRLCYNQPEPIYDPSYSSSYQNVTCDSDYCKSLQSTTGFKGVCTKEKPSPCYYTVSYGDGSYTRGDLGREQMILGDTNVSDFVFGCGRNNKGLFGAASGLMGLGRSGLSLISQTTDIFGGVFSYCLPPTQGDSSGSLILGGDFSAYKNTTPISYTKLLSSPQLSTFYILNNTGASIGGVPIQSPSFGIGGILIDSGTVISRLPPSLYKAVKTEFLKQFTGYPPAPSFSILDTCFNLSAYDEVNIPTIKMQFEDDVELTVDVTGVFYFVKSDASQVCLALASLTYENEIGILGNYQQRNTRVIYDTVQSKLGLAKESCNFM
ncbi:hypothetical protein Leryth_003021 [Lithospermum erythrorhizon]|nr:hypothetical protein Leryth_003021 [Lithospermum erythrorhizon]